MIHILLKNSWDITIVDDEDSDLIRYHWSINSYGYACRWEGTVPNRQQIFMHRQILDRMTGRIFEAGEVTDHINGNKLDNRRANLRIVGQMVNQLNRHKINSNNTSGYKGVDYRKREGKWRARIAINGKNKYLGIFSSPEEAARAYIRELSRINIKEAGIK